MDTKAFLSHCADELTCSVREIVRHVEFYNGDFSAYDNSIYSHVATRIAHWVNFADDNWWFNQRLWWPLDNAAKYDVVVDVGFSAPYCYARRQLRDAHTPRWVFADKENSAREFYKVLTKLPEFSPREHRDRVICADVESSLGRELIVDSIARLRPNRVLLVASEVIEHLDAPNVMWDVVQRIETVAGKCDCYVTLPVGERIPSHKMEFLEARDAARFVQDHLAVEREFTIAPLNGEWSCRHLTECYCALGTAKSRAKLALSSSGMVLASNPLTTN